MQEDKHLRAGAGGCGGQEVRSKVQGSCSLCAGDVIVSPERCPRCSDGALPEQEHDDEEDEFWFCRQAFLSTWREICPPSRSLLRLPVEMLSGCSVSVRWQRGG